MNWNTKITDLEMINETSIGVIYDVHFYTPKTWFSKEKSETIRVYLHKGINILVRRWDNAGTLHYNLVELIEHDYELITGKKFR